MTRPWLHAWVKQGRLFVGAGLPVEWATDDHFFRLALRCGEENESRKARCHLAVCRTSQLGGSPDHTIRRLWERVKSRQTSSDSAKVKTTCEDRRLPLATWLRSANRTASRGTTVNRIRFLLGVEPIFSECSTASYLGWNGHRLQQLHRLHCECARVLINCLFHQVLVLKYSNPGKLIANKLHTFMIVAFHSLLIFITGSVPQLQYTLILEDY